MKTAILVFFLCGYAVHYSWIIQAVLVAIYFLNPKEES